MTAYFTTLLQVTAQLTSLVAILREHVQDPVSVWMKKFSMAWKMATGWETNLADRICDGF